MQLYENWYLERETRKPCDGQFSRRLDDHRNYPGVCDDSDLGYHAPITAIEESVYGESEIPRVWTVKPYAENLNAIEILACRTKKYEYFSHMSAEFSR